MAKIGLHRFSVRYQYEVETGFDKEKRQKIYKSKTATRTVECETADPKDKDLAAILEQSHRKESPLNLKVLAFEAVDTAPKAQPQTVDEGLKSQVANLQARVEALEVNVQILANSIDELAERISPPEGKSSKPDDKGKAKS